MSLVPSFNCHKPLTIFLVLLVSPPLVIGGGCRLSSCCPAIIRLNDDESPQNLCTFARADGDREWPHALTARESGQYYKLATDALERGKSAKGGCMCEYAMEHLQMHNKGVEAEGIYKEVLQKHNETR
jgi:hypothetical protein